MRPTLVALSLLAGLAPVAHAEVSTLSDAFTQGSTKLDFNLRYEYVEQDNILKDADAFTLRTRLTYSTAPLHGLSGLVEFEDSRNVFGVDDYNDGNGSRPGYSVIADPNTTELDQFLLRYQRDTGPVKLDIKGGRQVIVFDNQRFVGHVGWRQDRQTFDGVTLMVSPLDGLDLNYGYISQRNRIFAEAKDVNANDHLINAGYKLPFGKLSGYGYLLDDEDMDDQIDTWGLRFAGDTALGESKLSYQLEWATQEKDTAAGMSFDADYYLLEAGYSIFGLTAKLGYEVLGSDSGQYGFSTPLATLHKFNGWADQFLTTPNEGLADLYLSVGGKLLSGSWAVIYHDFEADESSDGISDLGSEWDLSYSTKLAKHYTLGAKYAAYDAGDTKVDTDKFWLWASAAF
ncbi:alginate export family protein [Ferrimonas marina]|uniref:Alginate export n=1 Tax=Ferrimonas marina TaxID=299255 RepID=A0A1M5R2V6_9GAMM|nr:alginate export family protein [Ferrimonas marina]SHH20531.1 Alginate export [Ferrimonas marina]